ncbi:hypothetical protein CEW89_19470 [Celeribacter ethanolicus]|uniref:Uncharacterized protein n=1 Tax=Celeribacter ethanolicus TaxID=1758178 RepID=A0A291GGS2_9RHOB|nr:hypothetical protein [Celeribacter ethanolicus]ATG49559.1 hypothetical protein CEW89_19470 [Celeribacter ethanolicus]
MIDFLTFVASFATAAIAATIAIKANKISHASMRLEADKLLIEWSQQAVSAISDSVALRLLKESDISEAEFNTERRALRNKLFALKDAGHVLMRTSSKERELPAGLKSLEEATNILNGTKFCYPEKGDYETVRKHQVNALREQSRALTESIQQTISSEWFH